MRIVVTGGAGFIGSHVVDALLARGHSVAVLDNLSTGKAANVPPSAPLYEVDLRNREDTERVLHDFRPDAVSHHAAQVSVPRSVRDARVDCEINVVGGINLIDAMRQEGCRRMVFAGSGGTLYGEVADGAYARETDPAKPDTPYGISKFAFEQLLEVYRNHFGLNATVLRYANVYGPRQAGSGEAGVVGMFVSSALRDEPLHVNARRTRGDSGCIRDYVYVADVARANVMALECAPKARRINVATGVANDTLTLARAIVALSGSSSLIEYAPHRPGDLERSVLDTALSSSIFGPTIPLSDGLVRTIDWFRSSPLCEFHTP